MHCAAVVEKTEAEPAQASMGEEVIVETVKPHEDVVVKKKGGVQYIDLGLPSGTLWANVNDANGLTTYEDAVAKFGKQLPTKKQFTELREKCEWQNLKNGGYKVVGPNGNYITFPLTGFINCTGEFLNANKFGDYWTSTTDGTDEAYRVAFNEKNIIIALHPSQSFNAQHCPAAQLLFVRCSGRQRRVEGPPYSDVDLGSN